jgi:uncharacterized repeat protein (TIGR03806 family)
MVNLQGVGSRYFLLSILLSSLTACGGGSKSPGSGPSPSPESSSASSSMPASTSSSNGTSQASSGQPVGLATRPSNANCLAPETVGTGGGTINWPAAFPSLPSLSAPSALFQLTGDNDNWYVLHQAGIINRFSNQAGANSLTKVLDIQDRVTESGNETGLLGVAVHPQFASNRYVFLYYTGDNAIGKLESRVARYKVNMDRTFDKASEFILLRMDRPYSNHLGGDMAFGSDGYLYIASGDGGSGGDPHEYGQNKNTLLGKLLRIDVDSTSGNLKYAIPADNPFVGQANTRAEIWAYGLRNPWRFSFDKTTGDLWLGDVGQAAWEEINRITRGGNYGWGDMEGDTCYSGRPNCSTAGKVKPVHAINQSTGACSVIGGYVYRGAAYPAVRGKYFFSDYCVSTIKSITLGANSEVNLASHDNVPANLVAFAQDNNGELYALGQSGSAGRNIFKLQVTGGIQQPGTMATELSGTGCVSAPAPKEPASGLVPYDVISDLWSDGATKERYLALPNQSTINLDSDGDFGLPVGTVLVKHFKLDGKFVETRLFTHGSLGWQGFSYEWRDDQSDATLLNGAKDKQVGSVNWHFPSREECLVCHTQAANFALGPETLQLNSDFLYAATGITANQLLTLQHINLFTTPLNDTQKTAKLAALGDSNASLAMRARSYLHSNCSGCHRPGGPTTTNLDLRFNTSFANTHACNQSPVAGNLGINNAMLIAPGEPLRSVLLARMKIRDANQMPPIASRVVDEQAVQVIGDWISGLGGCE